MHLKIAECAQDCGWISFEQILFDGFQQPVTALELVIQGGGRRCCFVAQQLIKVLGHDAGQLNHGFSGAVIALHELFGCAPLWPVRVSEESGNITLQVEDQPVFRALCANVQGNANAPQQAFIVLKQLLFCGRNQAAGLQIGPVVAQAGVANGPQDRLQVAQAARALLGVGLKRVGGVFVFAVPLAEFLQLCLEKRVWTQPVGQGSIELLVQRPVTGQQAALQQSRLDRDIGLLLLLAVRQRSDRMPNG